MRDPHTVRDPALARALHRLRDWRRVARDQREQFHDIAPKIVCEIEADIHREWPGTSTAEVRDD